ncbi:hypothetical protein ACLKA7_016633 [Drosophila subpalustris]
MSGNFISLFLLALTAQSALSALVTHVDDGNVRVLPLGINRYNLRIRHSDGSVLNEVVNRDGPGEYQVMGKLDQPAFISAGNLMIGFNRHPKIQSPYAFVPQEQSRLISFAPIQQQFPPIQTETIFYPGSQPTIVARGAPPPTSPPTEPDSEDDWVKMYEDHNSWQSE